MRATAHIFERREDERKPCAEVLENKPSRPHRLRVKEGSMVRIRSSFAAASLVLLGACSKPDNAPPPPLPPSQAPTMPVDTAPAATSDYGDGPGATQAETIFKTRCSTCHGMDGHGNGPASLTLNPKPRNYTDVTWQRSVTDEHIKETIVKGGAAVGKSPLMAPNPDLADKPAVVEALLHKVRSFAQNIDAGAAAAASASASAAPSASAAKPAAKSK
jgi:mono/diheme cytochrome c family protein